MIAQGNPDNPVNGANAENLAYVIYTSGSTGRPKGVMNEHGGICNRLQWMQDAYALKKEDRVLQKTPVSFDVSVWEFFWPLMFGARLVVAKPGGHKDTRYLVKLINEHSITTIHFVPSMLQMFLLDKKVETCHSLKRVICSGEALSYTLQERFFARLDAELHNLYGPTEAAVDVTYWACQRQSELSTVPIGRPVANTQIHLLDAQLQPVPIGEPAELHIGGIQVARGYLNRPELTAEKFIPDPFSPGTNGRLYKTGDLARYLPDGNILYLGRLDHQVKIRGNRIELGEIEAVLSQHSRIREVAVVVQEYDPGDNRLAAYIVPNQEQSVSNSQLRDFLSKILPDFMIPATFTILDTMPLTPNGKVDRKALPIGELDRSTIDSHFVAPRNATEETLANIWAQVIGIKRVGINDNFFELGGDSILGIQITSKANQMGLYLTPDQLFHYPTIAQLADVAGTAPIIQAEQGVLTGPLPLTPIQHWFFEQNLLESHHWNQAFLLKAPPDIDASLLEKAIDQLLIHHDALRLRFQCENSECHQTITFPNEMVPVSQEKLSKLTKAEQKAAIESTATQLQASLNLSEGPLIRVALFETDSQELSYLLIIIHHLAVDGVSWRILLEHLELLYNQLSHNQAVQLPPKTTSYKHWAHQLTEYAQSDKLQQELHFWIAMQGKQPCSLPVDSPTGIDNNTVSSVGIISTSLNVEETEMLLKQVPKAYHTQINDVLLTALTQAVTQWTGASSLLVDLEGHGREAIFEDIDLLRTVGWFTTIFPVSLNLESTSNLGEMLKSIKEQLRRIPNRGIGYGLLRYLRNEPETAKTLRAMPQAELSFNYLGQFDQMLSPASPFKLTNESYGPRRSLRGNRRYLIEIRGSIVEGKLQLHLEYSKNIHHQSTIEKLAQGFLDALKHLIDHCQTPAAGGFTPSDFPEADLSQDELDDLMSEISDL